MKKQHTKPSKAELTLTIALILGMAVSAFLMYEHFAPGSSEFCNFGEGLDCGIVNKSPYANLDGIFYLMIIDYGWYWVGDLPLVNQIMLLTDTNVFIDFLTMNSFWGFLTLVLVLLLNTKYKNRDFYFVTKERNLAWIRGILAFGMLYGIFLIYIQHSILHTWCVFCLALDAVLLTTNIAAWMIKRPNGN